MAKMAIATTAKRCRPLVIASRPNNKTPAMTASSILMMPLKSACGSQTLPQVGKQLRNRLIVRWGERAWTDAVMTIALTSGESALEHGDLAHVAKSCGACVGSLRPQNENAKVLTQLAIARAMMRAGKPL
ncbi:hypothetical protein [Mesorhizobium sp. f-mel]